MSYPFNQTNMGLKLILFGDVGAGHVGLQSDQYGIETHLERQGGGERMSLQSDQYGIETHLERQGGGERMSLQSDQYGIETHTLLVRTESKMQPSIRPIWD